MKNEFVKPIRSEYADEHDYLYAYSQAIADYHNKCLREIGTRPIISEPTISAPKPKPTTGLERERYNLDSLADYLADRPEMLARYRKYGIQGLL